MESGFWCLFRGREDGARWAAASRLELAEWADLPNFEHYMGAMPFPFDIEETVACYERAKSDARDMGATFSHQYYASGFLESVYRIWHNEPVEP